MHQTSPGTLDGLVSEADPDLVNDVLSLTRRASAVSQLVNELTIEVLVLRDRLQKVVSSVAGDDPDARWTAHTYSGMRNLVELLGAVGSRCAELGMGLSPADATAVELRNWRGHGYMPAWALDSDEDKSESR